MTTNPFLALLDRLEARRLPLHSILIMQHDDIRYEAYAKPFTCDAGQRMYSVTKSFVALAVGLLEAEGKLGLDDPILSHFPEYAPADPDPWLAGTTIRDMLRMETCHQSTTYKGKDDPDWDRTFFTTRPDHPSGRWFQYDTSAAQVLGTLVSKLSGMDLVAYLRSRFVPSLSRNAHVLRNEAGEEMGGSGLVATTRDIAEVLKAMRHATGPMRRFIDEATARQADTFPLAMGGLEDLQQGYGYFIWRFTHGAWGFYGMGGQLGIVVPDKDLTIVTTAWLKPVHGALQQLFDALWEFVDRIDGPLPADEAGSRAERLAVPALEGSTDIPAGFPLEGTWVFPTNPTHLERCTITYDRTARQFLLACSMEQDPTDGDPREHWHPVCAKLGRNAYCNFPFHTAWDCLSSAVFDRQGNLVVWCQIIGEECGTVLLQCSVRDGVMALRVKKVLEPSIQLGEGVAVGTKA